MHRPRPTHWTLLALALLGLAGCKSDRGISAGPLTSVAVAAGDFDDPSEPLNRMLVEHAVYEGIIATPTWDPDWPHEDVALKVEGLLGSGDEMARYDAVFVASGTRGLGARAYNGLEADDHLVNDPEVIENVRRYVNSGRTLLVTDWAYDLVETAWPGQITFVGNDSALDAAQLGNIDQITADVTEEDLVEALGGESVALEYNYSNWALVQDVSEDVTVWIRGDAEYTVADGSSVETVTDAPMLVSFTPEGGTGRVVFATFHVNAQNDPVIDRIMRTVVGSFAGEPSVNEQF